MSDRDVDFETNELTSYFDKEESANKQLKPKKPKKYVIRKFVKEIKRVRWPSAQTNLSNFAQILVFTLLFTGFVFGVTYGFIELFKLIGAH
ncbi:preprotein translocase subunit SecE [Mycoplasma corogypsi]|uniref:preprotein translocase subunit SecE n=1 Tax=Mycoplasma corogypsi TaxID=2106 RepID=UPI003873BA7D